MPVNNDRSLVEETIWDSATRKFGLTYLGLYKAMSDTCRHFHINDSMEATVEQSTACISCSFPYQTKLEDKGRDIRE
jgi:hypothetical protein